ncbi:IS110 family transposase, partial [Lactobacillus crispatus]
KQILDLAQNKHYDQIIIGMEATSIYSFHPAYFFQNDEDLQKLAFVNLRHFGKSKQDENCK